MTKEIKTTKELYNFITSKVSPEEALMKLLESASIQYEKLKFDEDSQVHPIMIILMATSELGWNAIIGGDNGDIKGIVVGDSEYIDKNIKV